MEKFNGRLFMHNPSVLSTNPLTDLYGNLANSNDIIKMIEKRILAMGGRIPSPIIIKSAIDGAISYLQQRNQYNADINYLTNQIVIKATELIGESTHNYEIFKGQANCHNISPALISHQLEPNELINSFFNKYNFDIIHNEIIKGVKKYTNKDIVRQSDTQLQIIMRSIYFQYGKNNPHNIKQQIDELNKLVIDECIKIIISSIAQYDSYIKDINNSPQTLPLPINSNKKGNNSFALINF